MSLNEKHPYRSPGLQDLMDHHAHVGFTKEEAIAKALHDDKFKRMDIAKVLGVPIRTFSRRLASAQKKMKAPKRYVSSRDLISAIFKEAEDTMGKAIHVDPFAAKGRPSCPECGDPRPYPKKASWQCRACGKTWWMNPREDPEEFKDRPECPECGSRWARSKVDRWSCGRCGAQWYKNPDRRHYRKRR